MSLRIQQASTYLGSDRWEWSVWLEGSDLELDDIAAVKYVLHPSFPKPERVITNRQSGFKLKSAGWGEFRLKLELQHLDGRVTQRSHHLRLPYPRRSAQEKPNAKSKYQPHVFISSAAADAPLSSEVRRLLKQSHIEVLDPEVAPGSVWLPVLEKSLKKSDAMIAIVSDAASRWQDYEVATAKRLGLPMLVISVGQASLPPDDASRAEIHLRDASDIGTLQSRLVNTLSTLAKEES